MNYEKYPKSTFHCWGVNVDRASYWVKKKSNGQARYELFYETFFAHTGEGAARRLVPPTVVNPAEKEKLPERALAINTLNHLGMQREKLEFQLRLYANLSPWYPALAQLQAQGLVA